jgi:hypothetical protein
MSATLPRFNQNQLVSFIGGNGKILSSKLDCGTWTYAIEMEMGPLPSMGRIGAETTILLYEVEIENVLNF